MSVNEIIDNIFKLTQTPTHLKRGNIVDCWKLGNESLNTLMQFSTLLSIQVYYIEFARNSLNCFLYLFAIFVNRMCIFRKETSPFLFFVDCDKLRACSYCIDRVRDRIF